MIGVVTVPFPVMFRPHFLRGARLISEARIEIWLEHVGLRPNWM